MVLGKLEKVLLATGNKGKIVEFEKAFREYPLKWYGLQEFPFYDVEENGETFLENACIKAKAGFENSGLPTFADDSGLIVSPMKDYPGVRSARIGGSELSDRERCEYLINVMKEQGISEGVPAYFASTIVLVLNSHEIYWSEGRVDGEITFSMRGENGFGYDPMFYLPEYGKTMAELPLEKKNEISHRGRAIEAFRLGNYKSLK